MGNSRISFGELSLKQTRSGKCARCAASTRRVVKVWQTLNPYNRSSLGAPKSREEILAELRIELQAKLAAPLLCTSCEE